MNYVICHYHEIALKGKNRGLFERKLVENIKLLLPKESFDFVKNIPGRIVIKKKEGIENKKIKAILKNIPGIVNFSFAERCNQNIISLQKKSLEFLKKEEFQTFRVTTKRSNKKFPFSSQEVSEKVGAFIVDNMKKKVDLEDFDKNVFIEIVKDFSFIYLKKHKGLGGLPVGASGKGLVLISGGIDSPVAAFLAMKRGIKVSFIHFHSFPYTDKESINKVKRIVKRLSCFQFSSKLYLSSFADIQKEILLNVPAKFRVVLYKRMMNRIAEKIAEKNKIQALVTGESVGQVASQTLENIHVIESAVKKTILRPLICWNKNEIIKISKKIGVFDLSILPYQDCCTRFVPNHPVTKAHSKQIERVEKDLKINELVEKSIQETELIKINFGKK